VGVEGGYGWELMGLGKLALAALLGGAIGWGRERIHRPAGLRTYMLVALGSALFTLLSREAFGPVADPSRIASQIIVGIGFLGAGTLIRTGEWVRGLTTAAGLWTVAAIGMAVGVGALLLATSATALVLVVLEGIRRFEKKQTPPPSPSDSG